MRHSYFVKIPGSILLAFTAGGTTSPAASAGGGEREARGSATKVVGGPRFQRPAHRCRTCNNNGNERSGDPGHVSENNADESEAGDNSEPPPPPAAGRRRRGAGEGGVRSSTPLWSGGVPRAAKSERPFLRLVPARR